MKIILSFLLFISLQSFSQQPDSISLLKRDSLAEVVVVSKKPAVEYRLDKIVLNVASDINAAGGSVLDALKRGPGITVMNEETITMAGKAGVDVLVNGRRLQLEGRDLANYLLAIPAASVEQIEIITNPSAKYDAQGNAGIINIKMVRNIARGINANLNSGYTLSDHYRANLSGTVNVREGRWNVYAKFNGGSDHQHTAGSIIRRVQSDVAKKEFRNITTDIDKSEDWGVEAGADLYLDKRNSFGFIAKTNHDFSPMLTPGITEIASNNRVDSSLRTLVSNRNVNRRNNYNLNYKYEDTLGNVLNIDLDKIFYSNEAGSSINTDFLDRRGSVYQRGLRNQLLNTKIDISSLKIDFSKTLKKNLQLETGLKANEVEASNDLDAFQLISQTMKADTGRTNNFNYRERILAAYSSLTINAGKWQIQGGLRLEHTSADGRSLDLHLREVRRPDSSYLNIFPTAFMRYELTKKSSIRLAYSRRINRASYQDLNPFQFVFDNYTTESGNPFLLPEMTQALELSWVFDQLLNISTGFSSTRNTMQNISRQYGEITDATRINLGKEKRLFMNIGTEFQFMPWWSFSANFSPFYRMYNGTLPEGKLDVNTGGMNWYVNNTFKLKKKWKGQLSSWGSAGTVDGMYRTAWLGSLDAGMSKSIFKDRCMLRLTMIDIFNTQRWLQRARFANVDFDYRRKWESRGLRLQISWKIGKKNYSARNRNTGAEDENGRIK